MSSAFGMFTLEYTVLFLAPCRDSRPSLSLELKGEGDQQSDCRIVFRIHRLWGAGGGWRGLEGAGGGGRGAKRKGNSSFHLYGYLEHVQYKKACQKYCNCNYNGSRREVPVAMFCYEAADG